MRFWHLFFLVFFIRCGKSDQIPPTDSENYGRFELLYLYKLNDGYRDVIASNENASLGLECTNDLLEGIRWGWRADIGDVGPFKIDTLTIDFGFNWENIGFKALDSGFEFPRRPVYINHIKVINKKDSPNNQIEFQYATNQFKYPNIVLEELEGSELTYDAMGMYGTNDRNKPFVIHFKSTNYQNLRSLFLYGCTSLSEDEFNLFIKKDTDPIITDQATVDKTSFDFWQVGNTFTHNDKKWRILSKTKL